VALKFKLMDVPITVGVDFVFMMVILGLLIETPEMLPAWLVIATGSVLLHELGHAAMFDYFGVRPAIWLHGGGGVTMGLKVPPRQHIVVAAAGPAIGLIIGGLVGVTALAAPRLGTNPIVVDLLWVNLGWSLLNLLPFPGLDGDAIVSELTTVVLGRPAEMAGRAAGMIVIAAVLVALVLVGQYRWAFTILFFGALWIARAGWRVGMGGSAGGAVSPAQLIIQGRYQEAFDISRRAMEDHPTYREPVQSASDALRLMSRYTDAEWGYSRILQSDPTNSKALRGRAFVRRRLGRVAEAEADLQTLLSLPSTEAITQAVGLFDADRHEDGLRLVTKATMTAQSFAEARALATFVAMFEYELGRENEALRGIDGCVAEMPDRNDLHELRARILCDLGRLAEARDAMRRALAGMERHPEYRETMGILKRMGGDPEGALEDLTFSATARPNDPEARGELAAGQVQAARVREARAALETLPGYVSANPFIAYARAAVAALEGSADEAMRLLFEARRARPELAVRAGVDPIFQALLADPARRAALTVEGGNMV
jgi:tetratricopeptide (TPR) repeat protein